jgi:hypothetical protein
MILFVRRIRNFFGYSLYLFAAFFASTVLVFAVAEKSQGLRSLLNLSAIRYFDFLDRYQPDPELVFVPRHKELSFEYETKGDIYSPYFSVDVDSIKLTGAYNAMAFRSVWPDNGVDLLVIGDSFVEIGETDSDLLSERIGMEAGLVTVNLGRGWYGPYQYLELLRRYGLSFGASCALLSFFSGNDIRDIQKYEEWQQQGWCYDWRPIGQSFFTRYLLAVGDTLRLVRRRLGEARSYLRRAGEPTGDTIHRNVGMVRLAGEEMPMAFAYRAKTAPPDETLASDAWRTLKRIMAEFRSDAAEHGILTTVVYIPTKIEVYAPLVTERSGADLLRDVETLRGSEFHAAESLRRIADELGMAFVDLLPEFRARAERGEVLFYPFDTHWNSRGREVAAEVIAVALRGQCGPRDRVDTSSRH